jgi:hypothetical protein
MSACRECGRLIAARVEEREDGVWFHKHCPDHGPQEVRVSSDASGYRGLGRFHRAGSVPLSFATPYRGCPDSCGLCPEHEQHVCLPILEITDHCDLTCPVCLVANRNSRHLTRVEVARMLDQLIASEGRVDVLNLSGGEPTLHPEFREIVRECAARPEITRVSVSTHSGPLRRRPDLLAFLAEHRVIVSLQFDGRREQVYRVLRGRPMLADKLDLIAACAKHGIPMSLTATIVPAVNADEIPGITELLFEHDHILSVMFQPAARLRRAVQLPELANARATIPDVIRLLDGAVGGTVKAADFSPLPCSHPACFALAFYLRTRDARFLSVKQLVDAERYLDMIRNRAIPGTDAEGWEQVRDAVYDLWSGPAAESPDSVKALQAVRHLLANLPTGTGFDARAAWALGERSLKSIFIHHFMDRETFDLSRARSCCQVYPQPDGRLIPACVFNCFHR